MRCGLFQRCSTTTFHKSRLVMIPIREEAGHRLPRAPPSQIGSHAEGAREPGGGGHEPLRRPLGLLEVEHDQTSAGRERGCRARDHRVAFSHERQGKRGDDAGHPRGKLVAGDIALDERDVPPPVRLDAAPRLYEHGVGHVDADQAPFGSDAPLDQFEVETRPAPQLEDRGSRLRTERAYGPAAVCPLAKTDDVIGVRREVVPAGPAAVQVTDVFARQHRQFPFAGGSGASSVSGSRQPRQM